ncbi:MAG: hypothetical protein KDN18_13240 [Verrucomicrobiae bacterium]|nr:hypothetical protein [Verrucomicrobiae bacterium]
MRTFPSFLVAVFLFLSVHSRGQQPVTPSLPSEEGQNAQLSAIGALAMQTVYATHMAMNSVADAWANEVYTDEVALTLAGSYQGGLGAALDAMAKVAESGGGLSQGDVASLSELGNCGKLVMDQIGAFIDYVPNKDPAKVEVFETKRIAAQKRVFALMGIKPGDLGENGAPSSPPMHLVFEIVKAQMPQGGPGQKGKAIFSRNSTEEAFAVKWEYTDGTFDAGFAVPFPASKAIAVGFGPDVISVAILELKGSSVKAFWAPYREGGEIGTYSMEQGENDSIYLIDGGQGGSFLVEEHDEGTVKLVWKYPSGEIAGYGVAVGEYLAAIAVKPGGQAGVAIYSADPATGTATGRWTMESVLGKVGTEEYRLLSVE